MNDLEKKLLEELFAKKAEREEAESGAAGAKTEIDLAMKIAPMAVMMLIAKADEGLESDDIKAALAYIGMFAGAVQNLQAQIDELKETSRTGLN